MPTERLTFHGSQGAMLAGRLESPAGRPPSACAVFAHCFTCSKDSRAALSISRALSALGFAVLRFDFTGLGESEGDFGRSTFTGSVGDVIAAALTMEARYGAPGLLVGHSLGGAAVVQAARSIPSVRGVVTLGAPSDPGHALRLFDGPDGDVAAIRVGERAVEVSRSLLDDLREATLLDAVSSLGRPLLVMHSPTDRIVSIDHAARIYAAARHPKSFVSLDDADHMLTRPADAQYVATVLTAWASRYLLAGSGRSAMERHGARTAGVSALARTAGAPNA